MSSSKVEKLPDDLVIENNSKIIFLVVDGLGDIQPSEGEATPLEAANTPVMDELAARNTTGQVETIRPGVIPGSPSGHLAVFGYDPIENQIGRGIVSALGINFELTEQDVAARVNFCSVDDDGRVTDRRAGRISTEENRRLCRKIHEGVELDGNVELFFETVSEHRALLVLRGPNLGGDLSDTDPQEVGQEPAPIQGFDASSETTADYVRSFLEQVREVLSDEENANMVLTRGYDSYEPMPSVTDRYGLSAKGIAQYPMYLGFARLVGMDTEERIPETRGEEFEMVRNDWENYEFFYVHVKKTDSYAEDGDFGKKKDVIEDVDDQLPELLELDPDVLVITADHSTPVPLKSHSWHPVPTLLASENVRSDETERFGESEALSGGLTRYSTSDLVSLALAHAGRLRKFGP